jgi:hypothetical protein
MIAMALAAASAVQAQPGAPPARPIPDAHPSASVNPPTTAGLKPGMPVKDSTGALIGTVTQVGQTTDGRPMAGLQIDGRQVIVPAGDLSVSQNGQAVSSMTKAQLQASAVRPG